MSLLGPIHWYHSRADLIWFSPKTAQLGNVTIHTVSIKPVLRILYVYPGSQFSSIPDPGSRIQ